MAKILKSVQICDTIRYLNAPKTPPPEEASDAPSAPELHPIGPSNEALEEARASGFDQGYTEGLAHAQHQFQEHLHSVTTLLETIPEALNAQRAALSDEIADIVLVIVQQLFINQEHNPDALKNHIHHTLSQLNDKNTIELSLHPHDLQRIQQGVITLDSSQCSNMRIIPDESLALGGCRIRSAHGLFDASIERQIDNLKQVLLQMKQGVAHA